MVEVRGVEPLAGLEMLGNVRIFRACVCIPENEFPQMAPHSLIVRFHFFGFGLGVCELLKHTAQGVEIIFDFRAFAVMCFDAV